MANRSGFLKYRAQQGPRPAPVSALEMVAGQRAAIAVVQIRLTEYDAAGNRVMVQLTVSVLAGMAEQLAIWERLAEVTR
jgi:hypothetical protein